MKKINQISLQNLFFNTNCYNALSGGTLDSERLYNIWSKSAKASNNEYKITEEIRSEIDDLNRKGYVRANRYSFKITPKGANVLKKVILNDDKSAFDE